MVRAKVRFQNVRRKYRTRSVSHCCSDIRKRRYHLGPLSSVSPRCGTTNNAQAQPLGVASRAAELGGGLWRAAVGKTGRLTVEWGTTVEHTVWGACAEHARLQLNDNDV